MFRSKNIDTIRRSSQRRNRRRLARVQRQINLEAVLSNISNSAIYPPPTTTSASTCVASVEEAQQVSGEDIDNTYLSLSPNSINIFNSNLDFTDIRINDNGEVEAEENQSLSFASKSEDTNINDEFLDDCNSCEDVDDDRNADNLLMDSDNDELFDTVNEEDDDDDANEDDELFNVKDHTNRQFTTKEIAIVLSILKSRHSLTNTCITNLCKLLKLLRVPNAPLDFRHLRSLICSPYQTNIFGKPSVSCPSCYKISSSSTSCTSSSTCISKSKFVKAPTVNYVLSLEPQIRSVLERNHLINPKNGNFVTDIVDSSYYKEMLCAESNPFITLLMNSDGAVVKSISRSIWITSFVINELEPSIRFNRENIIVGMISVGSSKPHEDEMQLFLNDLVKELIYLEHRGLQYNPKNSCHNDEKITRVFLMAAGCDMPATSLLINHTEPSGYYGCVHCKIVGENVKVGDGNTRIFVYDASNHVELRSNQTYDEAIGFIQPLGLQRHASITSLNSGRDGLRGPCALRDLKYFDVYESFTCDTLHTLYEGATARMLHIFFGNVSKKSGISAEMNIKKELDKIALIFKETFYPSSTYRIPRDLKLFHVYKANELKVFLLFGYLAFKGILTREKYDHFRCLVFAAHLIEASKHDQLTYHDILDLLHEFYSRFELFYTKKQAKPVIHALSHFADTIKNYGPAHNYSTFEFESSVAELTRTIHNGNQPTRELLRNIDLLQQTWLATSDSAFPGEMQLFYHQIHANIRYSMPACLSDLNNPQKIRLHKIMSINSLSPDTFDTVLKSARGRTYKLFKTIFINSQRYSADSISTHRSTHDGCVLYDDDNVATVGFIETIINFIQDNAILIVIRPVILMSTGDSLTVNGRIHRCTNVLYGTSHGSSVKVIHHKSVIQKLAFRYGENSDFPPLIKSMFFFQFPNLHSST